MVALPSGRGNNTSHHGGRFEQKEDGRERLEANARRVLPCNWTRVVEAATRQTSFIGYFLRDEQVERYSASKPRGHPPCAAIYKRVTLIIFLFDNGLRLHLGEKSKCSSFVVRSFSVVRNSLKNHWTTVSCGRFRVPRDTSLRLTPLEFIRCAIVELVAERRQRGRPRATTRHSRPRVIECTYPWKL